MIQVFKYFRLHQHKFYHKPHYTWMPMCIM